MEKEKKDYLSQVMRRLEEAMMQKLSPSQYCGYGGDERTLEDRLWEYAGGLMEEWGKTLEDLDSRLKRRGG